MFESLKAFLGDLAGETPRETPFEAADYQLAAAALMVDLASVDGEFDARERARLQEIVETRFGLNKGRPGSLLLTRRKASAIPSICFASPAS